MNAYADTGFVVTLYKEEATSASAAALIRPHSPNAFIPRLPLAETL